MFGHQVSQVIIVRRKPHNGGLSSAAAHSECYVVYYVNAAIQVGDNFTNIRPTMTACHRLAVRLPEPAPKCAWATKSIALGPMSVGSRRSRPAQAYRLRLSAS
jgi:hypothetical protein